MPPIALSLIMIKPSRGRKRKIDNEFDKKKNSKERDRTSRNQKILLLRFDNMPISDGILPMIAFSESDTESYLAKNKHVSKWQTTLITTMHLTSVILQ
jgi:hypothetical protein